MPGKLFLDPQRDGTTAFKPSIASAYCAGARAQQQGVLQNDAPPGLGGEALDNWEGGWTDAQTGARTVDGACAVDLFGPELIPSQYFRQWTDPTFPDGWTLTQNDGLNLVRAGVDGSGIQLISQGIAANTPNLTLSNVMDSVSAYRIEYIVRLRVNADMVLNDGFAPITLSGTPGVKLTLNQVAIGAHINLSDLVDLDGVDVTLHFLSVRKNIG